jgi:hypothetical protein
MYYVSAAQGPPSCGSCAVVADEFVVWPHIAVFRPTDQQLSARDFYRALEKGISFASILDNRILSIDALRPSVATNEDLPTR